MAITTAWMWAHHGEIRALRLDVETGQLRWYDTIGCHCTDEEYVGQSLEAYRHEGAPAFIGLLPADVEAELDLALAHLSESLPLAAAAAAKPEPRSEQ